MGFKQKQTAMAQWPWLYFEDFLMSPNTWKLAFDPTAALLTHLIVDEAHTVVSGRKAIIYPKWGAFYEGTLVYYSVDSSTDTLYDPVQGINIYPVPMDLDTELSRLAGRAVYRSFILDLTNFVGNTSFLITYQTPGGDNCINDEHLENARIAGLTPADVDYKDIIGLPKTFDYEPHQERAQLAFGIGQLVEKINTISGIVASGNAEHKKSHEYIARHFTNLFDRYYKINKTKLIKKDTAGNEIYEFEQKVNAGKIAQMAVGSIKIVDKNQITFRSLTDKSAILNNKYNLYKYVLDWHINYKWWDAAKALGDNIAVLPADFNLTVAVLPGTGDAVTTQIGECLDYNLRTTTVSPFNNDTGMCMHYSSNCAFRTEYQALNNDKIFIRFNNLANSVQSLPNGIIKHSSVNAYKSQFKINNVITDVYTSKAVLLDKEASLYDSTLTASNFIASSTTGFAFFGVLQYRPGNTFTLLCHIKDRTYIASDPMSGIAIGIIDLITGMWLSFKRAPFQTSVDTIIGINYDIEHKHLYYYVPYTTFDPYEKTSVDYQNVPKLAEIDSFACERVLPYVTFLHRYSGTTNEQRLIKQVSVFNKSISIPVFMMLHKKFLFAHYAGRNNNKHPIGFARHHVKFYE